MPRHVFDNAQTIHVWAAQTQPSGRSHNGNLSFDGPTLYSYSTPIANIVPGADGAPVAIITSHTYSVTTTGKHMPHSRDVSHMRRFSVPCLMIRSGVCVGRYREPVGTDAERHAANVAHFLTLYASGIAGARRARELPYGMEDGAERASFGPGRYLDAVRSYCATFALPLPADLPDYAADLDAIRRHHMDRAAKANTPVAIAKRARDAARRAERDAAREAAAREASRIAREDAKTKLTAWLDGVPVALPWEVAQTPSGGAYVRVRENVVETSSGARVPLAHAKRLLAMAAQIRASGREWAGSVPVGAFVLRHIAPNGDARVGCHFLEFAEMLRAAERAGIAVPTDAA